MERLEKARTKVIVLREFLAQYEQLTNSKLTGVDDTLKEIDEDISVAYIELVEKGE